MKQILKKSKVFILGGLLLFYSCTQEKDFVNQENHHLRISEKSFDELSRLTSFRVALKKIPKKKPSSDFATESRSAIENEFDFTFSNKPAKVIEDETKTSYTFLIYRTDKTKAYFENLIIEIYSDMKSRAAITKYIYSDESVLEQPNKIGFSGAIKTNMLFDEIDPNSGSLYATICIDVTITHCAYAGMEGDCGGNDVGCHSVYSLCSGGGSTGSGSTGSGSTGSGSAGAGGGGSGSGGVGSSSSPSNNNNTNNITTTIVAPNPPLAKTPCKQLNELMIANDSVYTDEMGQQDTLKSPKLKQKLDSIAPAVNKPYEIGFELEYSKFNNKFKSTFVPPPVANSPNFSVELSVSPRVYGSVHNHPLNSVGVPSFGDLVWLRDCYLKTRLSNKEKVVMFVVVKNPAGTMPPTKTYALKVDDFAVLNAQINLELSKFIGNTIEDKIEDALDKESDYYGTNRLTDAKLFLQKYATIGASLYEANANLTKFEKLVLNGNTVTKQPCPELQQQQPPQK